MKLLINSIVIMAALLMIGSCEDNEQAGNPEAQEKEELIVYNDIIYALADTSFYLRIAKENNNKSKAVFYLNDTLSALENSNFNLSDKRYMSVFLPARKFAAAQISSSSIYRFTEAGNEEKLKLEEDEWYSGKVITLSRVCFNATLDKGFLFMKISDGDLSSSESKIEIEKDGLKWKIVKRYEGRISLKE